MKTEFVKTCANARDRFSRGHFPRISGHYFIACHFITRLLGYIMPTLILDDLRKIANNRKIPNADRLDFVQLLQALANPAAHVRNQTNCSIGASKNSTYTHQVDF